MKIALVGSLGLFALAAASNANTLATSDFTFNTNGWDTFSYAVLGNGFPNFAAAFGGASAVAYNSSGGNPGAFVSAADNDNGWQYFQAGVAFSGNFGAAFGGSLNFDEIRLDPFLTPLISPPGPVVAITDGTLILVYSGPETAPNTAGWTSYTIPLLANGFWTVGNPSGAAATPWQLAGVLSSLSGLYILGDWTSGAPGTANPDQYGLENVAINSSATPEPATGLLLAIGLTTAFLKSRFQRR